MLSIKRDPFYKNRYFLSGVAVFAGFLVTVAIIRAANPIDTSTNQSAQSNSERRAKSIIPIDSSESEKSFESKKDDAADGSIVATPEPAPSTQPAGTGSAAASGYSIEPVSAEGWTQPPKTTSTNSSSQPSSAPASSPSSTTTSSNTSSAPAPAPAPSNPQPTCTINILGLCI